MSRVSMIVARADNGAIGKDNQLIWHLSEDLKNFKRVTHGHPILMGRKTFESIGRPLPGRDSIVITRDPSWSFDGVRTASSLEEALSLGKNLDAEEVFILGGGEIYRQSFEKKLCQRLYLTTVHLNPEADVFLQGFNENEWSEVETFHYEKTENQPAWTYQVLER